VQVSSDRDPIRILVVEDNAVDADLIVMTLRRAGLKIEPAIAADERELRLLVTSFTPDVVLCDFSLHGFDGFAAQKIVSAVHPRAPMIFVSGSISEEDAAMALRSGAVDYVMKSSLARLPNAVVRAADAAGATIAAEEAAQEHAARLEALWRTINDPDAQGTALIDALLVQAGSLMSRHQLFRAVLGRIDGEDVLIVGCGPALDGDILAAEHAPGVRVPLALTRMPLIGRSQAWKDISTDPSFPARIGRGGWKAVIATQFELSGDRYALHVASITPAMREFRPDDFAYLDSIASALANAIQVNALEMSLRDEEERSRMHATRLESLWAIVNDAKLGEDDMWLAMLGQAAVDISPGQRFHGILWRIDGSTMVCEAHSVSGDDNLTDIGIAVGFVAPTAGSIVESVIATGVGTRSWNDFAAQSGDASLAERSGIRSCIVTSFHAGESQWALVFASGSTVGRSFGEHEHAYVEVLASFFSNHVQQRWQGERLRYERTHDELTGLLNRAAIASQVSTDRPYGIVLLDINAFHEVNALYGQAQGDAMLTEIAAALAQCAFQDETIGRTGGNVFAIHLHPRSIAQLSDRARAFTGALRRVVLTGQQHTRAFTRTASAGFAWSDGNVPFDSTMEQAEAALTVAKSRGHGSIVFYETGMELEAHRRATLRAELSDAIAGSGFELYFQPVVEIGTRQVSGCEALIRWNHPSRGLISPDEFIPFAEETGLIAGIDAWVMREAFASAMIFAASRPDFRLYFNLSGRQTGDAMLPRAFIEAARRGVTLANLGIEITETDAMRDVEATRRVFRTLRRLNVRLAIDDFGTGYSSLSSLKRLDVDVVKIDRSFVSGVTSDAHDAAIAETILSIAEHFGCDSLGEGAETPEQVTWLMQHGCRYVQGYTVCRPLPMAAFMAWFEAGVTIEQPLQADRRLRTRRASASN
jgi:diguanylate cyclase (GGDEF)-like protein